MEAPFVRSFHFRFLTTCLLVLLCSMVSAQKRVSILGDSYSAYYGYNYPSILPIMVIIILQISIISLCIILGVV